MNEREWHIRDVCPRCGWSTPHNVLLGCCPRCGKKRNAFNSRGDGWKETPARLVGKDLGFSDFGEYRPPQDELEEDDRKGKNCTRTIIFYILCWLGFHQWSRWSDPVDHNNCFCTQERRCLICNYWEDRIEF